MSKRRISVLVGSAVGFVSVFGLLLYLPPVSSVGHAGGLLVDYHLDQEPSLTEHPSAYSFKVPGELDGFTPHVWQTTGPKNLTTAQKKDIASWREKHPFFSFTLMTDEQGDSFVREHYPNRPDIVDLFLRLRIQTVKADLFRYLVLVAKGGICAVIDVFCEQPISKRLPPEHMDSIDSINLIVGLEFYFGFRGEGAEVSSQFTNWVIASKPGNKYLMHAVDRAVTGLYAVAEKNKVDLEHLELWMLPDVVNIAGPKRMTIAILESLSEDLNRLVDDRVISGAKEPRLVGDVVIMPNNAFAAIRAGFPSDRVPLLVTHHYAGSWKESADAAKAQKQKMGAR